MMTLSPANVIHTAAYGKGRGGGGGGRATGGFLGQTRLPSVLQHFADLRISMCMSYEFTSGKIRKGGKGNECNV